MPVADVVDIENKKVKEINLKEKVFQAPVKESCFYEVVKMQLANKRLGTASTKTRGMVRGSGAKPWRQKGTGRARVCNSPKTEHPLGIVDLFFII